MKRLLLVCTLFALCSGCEKNEQEKYELNVKTFVQSLYKYPYFPYVFPCDKTAKEYWVLDEFYKLYDWDVEKYIVYEFNEETIKVPIHGYLNILGSFVPIDGHLSQNGQLTLKKRVYFNISNDLQFMTLFNMPSPIYSKEETISCKIYQRWAISNIYQEDDRVWCDLELLYQHNI